MRPAAPPRPPRPPAHAPSASERPSAHTGRREKDSIALSPFHSQGALPLPALALRLSLAGAAATVLLSAPIAAASFDPSSQPLPFTLAALTGTFGLTTALAARILGGWSYVGGRLLAAAVPYEETGWYDGATFVKPPPVLARDRLLGTYEVKRGRRESEGRERDEKEMKGEERVGRPLLSLFHPGHGRARARACLSFSSLFPFRSVPPSPA